MRSIGLGRRNALSPMAFWARGTTPSAARTRCARDSGINSFGIVEKASVDDRGLPHPKPRRLAGDQRFSEPRELEQVVAMRAVAELLLVVTKDGFRNVYGLPARSLGIRSRNAWAPASRDPRSFEAVIERARAMSKEAGLPEYETFGRACRSSSGRTRRERGKDYDTATVVIETAEPANVLQASYNLTCRIAVVISGQ